MTRDAAIREAALAAAVLLKIDLVDVLVAGWRDHRDIHSAARRTLATPGSKELVGVAPHRISTVQQPAVSILLDGHRVHTLQLGLSIIFEVTGLVAGISRGRLAGLHAGRGEVGVALTVHEIEFSPSGRTSSCPAWWRCGPDCGSCRATSTRTMPLAAIRAAS